MWELYAMWAWFAVFFSDALVDAGAARPLRGAAFATAAVIGVGALGSWTGGVLGDRWGRTRTTLLSMGLSGTSAIVTELADQRYVGTAVTLQLAAGFTLTVVTIWLIPVLEELVTWRWAFAVLAVGPALGSWAMVRLMHAPEAAHIAGGRG